MFFDEEDMGAVAPASDADATTEETPMEGAEEVHHDEAPAAEEAQAEM